MEILKYKPEHEEAVLLAIKNDPNWDMFTNDDAIDTYRNSLKKSVTYVCHDNSEFCGYVRALLDDGLAIYISELYVIPKCRNRKIGRSLLEQVKVDFSNLTVYALSDEDAYYDLGLGSVSKQIDGMKL
jgi:ribosomal protein S18 acetylase RimI-like enzyme